MLTGLNKADSRMWGTFKNHQLQLQSVLQELLITKNTGAKHLFFYFYLAVGHSHINQQIKEQRQKKKALKKGSLYVINLENLYFEIQLKTKATFLCYYSQSCPCSHRNYSKQPDDEWLFYTTSNKQQGIQLKFHLKLYINTTDKNNFTNYTKDSPF